MGRDPTKHFSVKKGVFNEKGGGNRVNEGFGKAFYRKGNSVKRSGHSPNCRTLKTEKLLSSSTSQKSAPMGCFPVDFQEQGGSDEPNWNWKPRTVGAVVPKTESGTGTAGTFSRNQNRNRPFLLNCAETQKTLV